MWIHNIHQHSFFMYTSRSSSPVVSLLLANSFFTLKTEKDYSNNCISNLGSLANNDKVVLFDKSLQPAPLLAWEQYKVLQIVQLLGIAQNTQTPSHAISRLSEEKSNEKQHRIPCLSQTPPSLFLFLPSGCSISSLSLQGTWPTLKRGIALTIPWNTQGMWSSGVLHATANLGIPCSMPAWQISQPMPWLSTKAPHNNHRMAQAGRDCLKSFTKNP